MSDQDSLLSSEVSDTSSPLSCYTPEPEESGFKLFTEYMAKLEKRWAATKEAADEHFELLEELMGSASPSVSPMSLVPPVTICINDVPVMTCIPDSSDSEYSSNASATGSVHDSPVSDDVPNSPCTTLSPGTPLAICIPDLPVITWTQEPPVSNDIQESPLTARVPESPINTCIHGSAATLSLRELPVTTDSPISASILGSPNCNCTPRFPSTICDLRSPIITLDSCQQLTPPTSPAPVSPHMKKRKYRSMIPKFKFRASANASSSAGQKSSTSTPIEEEDEEYDHIYPTSGSYKQQESNEKERDESRMKHWIEKMTAEWDHAEKLKKMKELERLYDRGYRRVRSSLGRAMR